MNIFVGNLNVMVTIEQLSRLFTGFGKVKAVTINRNALTGHSLGFGFVEMDNRPGSVAISNLHSLNFMNRFLEVKEAGSY